MRGKKNTLSEMMVNNIWNLYIQGINRLDISKKLNITEWSVRKELEGQCRARGKSLKLFHKSNTVPLTDEQNQLILGSLLGDASLTYRKDRDTYDFQVGHCLEQKQLVEYKAHLLNTNVSSYIKDDTSFSAGKEFFKTSYHNKYELEKIYDMCFKNGIKTVTEQWIDSLNEDGIAMWFMDDGTSSFSKNNVMVRFSTLSFPKKQLVLLQRRLTDFGISTTLQKHSDGEGYVIYIRQSSVNKFMDLIEPFIIECMKYKIKRK
jgi:LAGLIDADG DNA endonuclease family